MGHTCTHAGCRARLAIPVWARPAGVSQFISLGGSSVGSMAGWFMHLFSGFNLIEEQ